MIHGWTIDDSHTIIQRFRLKQQKRTTSSHKISAKTYHFSSPEIGSAIMLKQQNEQTPQLYVRRSCTLKEGSWEATH